MSAIRKLTARHFDDVARIVADAYPGMGVFSPEDIKRVKERLLKVERAYPEINSYGLFRNGELLGVMRLFDFTMTMLTAQVPAGGVGLVAVDLAHKKEHVCKKLIEYLSLVSLLYESRLYGFLGS